MAIISEELKLLYICVPKTGSTSMCEAIMNNFAARWLPSNHLLDKESGKIVVDYKHSSIDQLIGHKIITTDSYQGYNVIATTRNPFDWVASEYFFNIQCYQRSIEKDAPDWIKLRSEKLSEIAKRTFEEHVSVYYKNKKKSVYLQFVKSHEKLLNTKLHILKIENINEEIIAPMRAVGINNFPLIANSNVTLLKSRNYQEYYTDETKEIVAEAFSEDLLNMNYKF